MTDPAPPVKSRPPGVWANVGCGLLTWLILIAPWIRNREFLRELMDYGVVIAGVGRITAGQKPYVDFITPLQSGTLILNHWAEVIGGPYFLSLTWGNLAIMTFILTALWLALRHHISDTAAWFLAGTVVLCSAGQHTLIWYNSVGVLTLALATWTGAAAPILRRRQWGCHLGTTAALVWGGMNKLNFHAVALAIVLAWVLRQGLLGRATKTEVARSLVWWTAAGTLLPLGLELWWTGASLVTWMDNVVALGGGTQGKLLRVFVSPQFYLDTIHDYYGPVFRPAGLLMGLGFLIMTGVGWRGRRGPDSWLLIMAAMAGTVASLALLATNREIVYVGLAAAIAIGVSLWIGFSMGETSPRWPRLLLGGAVLLVVGHAFPSTWYGQRHQYGNNAVDRSTYRTMKAIPHGSTYFAGVRLAPEIAAKAEHLNALRVSSLSQHGGLPRVFFGRSLEGFNRIIPVRPGLPLWQSETTYGPAELHLLQEAFTAPVEYDLVVEDHYWRKWTPPIQRLLHGAAKVHSSHGLTLFQLDSPLTAGLGTSRDTVANKLLFGGNVDSRYLSFSNRVRVMLDEAGAAFVGVGEGSGQFSFDLPVREVSAEWVALLRDGTPAQAEVQFEIVTSPGKDGSPTETLWSKVVEFDAGPGEYRETVNVTAPHDGKVGWRVAIRSDHANQVIAGWTLPSLIQSADSATVPPPTDLSTWPESDIWRARARDFPDSFATPLPGEVQMIGAGLPHPPESLRLRPGSVLWLRSSIPWARLSGRIRWRHPENLPGNPVIHVLWYESGRLEIIQQAGLEPDREYSLEGWPSEDFGWYGIRYDSPAYYPTLDLTELSLTP